MSTYYKATIGGTMVGAQEWSCGVHLVSASDESPTSGQMSTWANTLFDAANTAWWSKATNPYKGNCSTSTNINEVRTYLINQSTGTAEVVGVSSKTPVAGTSTSNNFPQLAVVATLLTGFAGRRNQGRVYLPLSGAFPTNTLQVNLSFVQAYVVGVADWLAAWSNMSPAGNPISVCVGSTRQPGHPVTAVRMDTVVDTQRRRRDKLVAGGVAIDTLFP